MNSINKLKMPKCNGYFVCNSCAIHENKFNFDEITQNIQELNCLVHSPKFLIVFQEYDFFAELMSQKVFFLKINLPENGLFKRGK